MQLRDVNGPGGTVAFRASRHFHRSRHDRTSHDAARPPGPRGGDATRTLARLVTGRPLEACTALFARYGDTVYLPVPPWEGLYVFSRPEQAEHVLATNQDNYVKPFTYRPLRMLLGDGLLTGEDPLWRRHRRIIQPVFSTRNVASFAADMDAGAQRAVARWRGSQAVDAAAEMSTLTLDVVGRVLFGTDLLSDAPPLRRALVAGQWLALLAAFLPIPWGPTSTRLVRRAAQPFGAGAIQQQVEHLIARRQEQSGASAGGAADTAGGGREGQGPRDLLSLLIAARDADGCALSQQEIRDEISTFLVAGHETTAMALTWSLALLSAYPQARQRLEDEVDAVLGDGPADPDTLPWTTAVISEAMRLYPPAWTLERTAVADDDVCGTPVPAGSMVAVLPYLVHRNPAVWPNPAGFDPGRFLPGAPERAPVRLAPVRRRQTRLHRRRLRTPGGRTGACPAMPPLSAGPGRPRHATPPRLRHTPPRRTGHHAPHPPRLTTAAKSNTNTGAPASCEHNSRISMPPPARSAEMSGTHSRCHVD